MAIPQMPLYAAQKVSCEAYIIEFALAVKSVDPCITSHKLPKPLLEYGVIQDLARQSARHPFDKGALRRTVLASSASTSSHEVRLHRLALRRTESDFVPSNSSAPQWTANCIARRSGSVSGIASRSG